MAGEDNGTAGRETGAAGVTCALELIQIKKRAIVWGEACFSSVGLVQSMAVSKVPATLPFDEIVPGAIVRFCVIDGVQYLSIRDMIMCVCGKDNKDASKIWDRLTETQKEEVFHGQGQSEQPVITFVGALKLIMFLPGEAAKKHRSAMADILRRYFAGDASLLDEIERNQASDSPIAQMARASLAAEGGARGIEDSHKRKREELELAKIEAEIEVMTNTSRMHLMDKYHSYCLDTVLDERAKVMFKEALLNSLMVKQGDSTDGKSVPTNFKERPESVIKIKAGEDDDAIETQDVDEDGCLSVRVVLLNGKQYLSTRDVVKHTIEKTGVQVARAWARVKDQIDADVLETHKFKGSGEVVQDVIERGVARWLVRLLPGEAAERNRKRMLDAICGSLVDGMKSTSGASLV
jgi:hypothetical protein